MRSKRFAISCFCLLFAFFSFALIAAPAYSVYEEQSETAAQSSQPAVSQAEGYIIELKEPPVLEKKAAAGNEISSLLKQAAQAAG